MLTHKQIFVGTCEGLHTLDSSFHMLKLQGPYSFQNMDHGSDSEIKLSNKKIFILHHHYTVASMVCTGVVAFMVPGIVTDLRFARNNIKLLYWNKNSVYSLFGIKATTQVRLLNLWITMSGNNIPQRMPLPTLSYWEIMVLYADDVFCWLHENVICTLHVGNESYVYDAFWVCLV